MNFEQLVFSEEAIWHGMGIEARDEGHQRRLTWLALRRWPLYSGARCTRIGIAKTLSSRSRLKWAETKEKKDSGVGNRVMSK